MTELPESTVLAADYFHAYSVVGLLAVIGVLFVAVAFGAAGCCAPWSRRRRNS